MPGPGTGGVGFRNTFGFDLVALRIQDVLKRLGFLQVVPELQRKTCRVCSDLRRFTQMAFEMPVIVRTMRLIRLAGSHVPEMALVYATP